MWTAVVMAFLVIRVPIMYLQPGSEDEDCYSVPGLTILKTGLPQLPHVPARNPESVYYLADRMLFSEPPLMFYLQSLFYLVLPDVQGTPRMLSAVCGILSLGLLWWLSRRWLGTALSPVWAIGLFSVSRWFYFPATRARPDVVAAVLGFAVLAALCQWERHHKHRWLVAAGVGIGFGGLAHPFAMAYALQAAAWLMITSRGWQRVTLPALVAGVAILTACLWVPLILMEPEAFRMQFHNQFFAGSDGSLLGRLISPWRSLSYHGRFMWKFLGPWQCLLAVLPTVVATVQGFRQRRGELLTLAALSWSGIYLIAAFVGAHHPTLGYWMYPAGLMFLTTGGLLDATMKKLAHFVPRRVVQMSFALLLLAAMIPGSGLRTFAACIEHWGDPNYNVTAFSRQLMERIPADEVCVVDTQFALEFVAAGRKTLLAQTLPVYFLADDYQYDHLIVSRFGMQTGITGRMCVTEMQWSAGLREDIFACYAEVYGQAEFPCPAEKQTPHRPVGEPF